MKEYCKWSIYRVGMNPHQKYKAYCYVLPVGSYIMDQIVNDQLKPSVCNHIITINQSGLLYFIVDELIDSDRKQHNVISSVTKMLKRLDRI